MSKKADNIENLTTEYIAQEIERYGRKERRKSGIRWTAFLMILVIAIIVAIIKLPILRIYGSSMEPTFSHGDIVVSMKDNFIRQGDLISFYYNNNILVKRVVAFEGDMIDITQDGTLYINGVEQEEPYIYAKALGKCNISLPYEVPEGCYFVMGDHRSTSEDSRSKEIGPIPRERVVGKIKFCLWGLPRIGKIQ